MMSIFSAQLGHDHADARPARADAGTDRVDALRMRLDRDLRAVAGLARDTADLDEPVGDLRNLDLEQGLDQLGIAAERITCGPFVLDRTSVITALIREPCS